MVNLCVILQHSVILKMLITGAIAKTSFYEESILPHVMFNMSCTGNEGTIFNCSYSTKLPSGSDCHSTEDASVICQGKIIVVSIFNTTVKLITV